MSRHLWLYFLPLAAVWRFTNLEPQALREHNCLFDSSASSRKWAFKKSGREIVVEVKGSFSSNSAAILSKAALDGMGVIKVPRYSVQTELSSGKLKAVFDDMTQSQERMRAYYSKPNTCRPKSSPSSIFCRRP